MKIDQKGGKEPQSIMTAPGKKKTSKSVSNSDRNTGSSAATSKYIFTAEQGTYAWGFV